MVNTNILKIKGSWAEILDDCRFTANKGDLNKEPSEGFKKKILLSEHSPIRNMSFKWEWSGIPTWVSVHWVRHKWEKYVRTQRTDRTGSDRHSLPQDSPVDMRGEANVQHLIDTMRKRLCKQASDETRECAESLKNEIGMYDSFIADVFVPNCIYRSGCPEEAPCGFWGEFIRWCAINKSEDPRLLSIQTRYDYYNEYFEELYSEKNYNG